MAFSELIFSLGQEECKIYDHGVHMHTDPYTEKIMSGSRRPFNTERRDYDLFLWISEKGSEARAEGQA